MGGQMDGQNQVKHRETTRYVQELKKTGFLQRKHPIF